MKSALGRNKKSVISPAMMLVTLGIVYGDIGTSPMYVLKSIIEGNGGLATVSQDLIIGSLSLIIWTVTLLTTIKYVVIAMRADNHGEGGIFSLFSLVKKYGKYLVIPAMLGGASLLADGILTPAVTITTAIEGLRSIPGGSSVFFGDQSKVIIITLAIISLLFLSQRAGTEKIGRAFGPVMLTWFLFLATAGVYNMSGNLYVLKALNPVYAVKVLFSDYNKEGFMILGSVFLAATGAEALYSDMGHVERGNIYVSWPFVKICLILNYLGQGAWLISNSNNSSLAKINDLNPFFLMLPANIRPFAVLLGALAAIIASQALISGSFSLVSEAIRLDLMPHMQIIYPSKTKGQLYIPLVNIIMWIGCCFVVLHFKTGARMEAAYGLAITVTMLMTTFLLTVYLAKLKNNIIAASFVAIVFSAIEIIFFISSLGKFFKGGYLAAIIAICLFVIMLSWKVGTEVERKQSVKLKIRDYIPVLKKLKNDESVPKLWENIVFITNGKNPEKIDRDILYSILDKGPKRANAYWFVNINVTDDPYTSNYKVESYGTDFIFHITVNLGFKRQQRINVCLRSIISELTASGDLPHSDNVYSIYPETTSGSFKFFMLRKTFVPGSDISSAQKLAIYLKYKISNFIGSPSKWYGLENSNVVIEYVPLFVQEKPMDPFKRSKSRKKQNLNKNA